MGQSQSSRPLNYVVSRKQRKIDDYKRREAFKEARKSILIVCEGEETEPIYFKALKRRLRLIMVDVEIVGEGAAPITVVNSAIQLREGRKQIARKSLTKALTRAAMSCTSERRT